MQCRNAATSGHRFCSVHDDELDGVRALIMAGAALAGNTIAPGLGGVAVGALTGRALDGLFLEETRVTKRVFVSFDFDNDRVLKEFIIGQARLNDSPFTVIDCSLKEAAPMKSWEEKARRAIKGADLVLVMVGRQTHRASGVLKEVRMAREEDIPIVQMIGYKEGTYTGVPNAGRLYRWNWDNLKKLLTS